MHRNLTSINNSRNERLSELAAILAVGLLRLWHGHEMSTQRADCSKHNPLKPCPAGLELSGTSRLTVTRRS